MLDNRNRPIKYKDGKRIFHQPVNDIIKCFDVQTIEFEPIIKHPDYNYWSTEEMIKRHTCNK